MNDALERIESIELGGVKFFRADLVVSRDVLRELVEAITRYMHEPDDSTTIWGMRRTEAMCAIERAEKALST